MTNDERHTAYHEASHAVIGRVLGMVCGGATIAPDEDSAGHAITADPYVMQYQWELRGHFREFRTVLRGRILTYMAGRAAEIEFCGSCQGGDGDDRLQIARMFDDTVPYLDDQSESERDAAVERCDVRLQAVCATLVKRHRAKVERVAAMLIERRTLAAQEIDALLV